MFKTNRSLAIIVLFLFVVIMGSCGGGGGGGTGNGDGGEDENNETTETFTLSVDKFGEGSVVSDISGINCGNDCNKSYPSGATVVLTATADSGSQINSWAGCDSTTDNTCTVTVNSHKTVFPTFALSTMSYQAGAVILDDATMQKLLSLDGTTYYFDSTATAISTLQIGDVIASSSGDGLLRRVESVSTTVDGQYAVETADAALEDVIEEGTITFSQDLTHGDLKAVATASKGVSLRKAATFSKDFIFDIDEVIYDADGSLTTEYDQVRAIGSVTANFTVDVAASIKEKEFKTILITKTAQDLKVIAGGDVQLINERVSLPGLTFGPFPVSGIIALNVDIAPYVGVEADVNAALTTRVTLDASSTAGVHYLKGEGWRTIKDFDSDLGFDPVDVTAEASVKGYVESEFALLLSDILGAAKGGPFINGEGYLRMNAGATSPLWWKLYGGIGASAGAKLKFLWWSVPDLPEVQLYNKEWELASSDTTSISDTTPPAIPSGLIASAVSSSQINLSWDESTDDVGVAGYKIYKDGAYIQSVTTTSFINTGLTSSTQYCYTVSAYDDASNESVQSAQVCATTPPASDTTSPSIPANHAATAVSSSQIDFSWDASTDNVGVAGYKVYRDGIPIKSVTTTTTSDTGLNPDTQYCYTVSAYDAAGNESGQSSQACATTQSSPPASTFNLPDTGQTQSSTATWGEDSDYTINPPSFTDNGDGTVTDNVTGFMWQKDDDNATRTWDESVSYCNSLTLGVYSDWRLPSKKELVSIVDYGTFSPAIDWWTYFPNTNASSYWSSTTDAGSPSAAWYVDFNLGHAYNNSKLNVSYVRCVRGGQYPSQSFTDNGNGTVTDNVTGFMWQQGEGGSMVWESALTYCEGLSLAGYTNWRLPNIRELESITDDTRYDPAIDATYFPNTSASFYWSSTTYIFFASLDWAWRVHFNDGSVSNGFDDKSNNYDVRCIRDGQDGWSEF